MTEKGYVMSEKPKISTKNLVITALFIALSFVGANIKVFGTVAFDSTPGFLASLLLGPAYGAAIGSLGHLFTAATSGFPLSVPLHLVIALSMAVTMLGFGFTYKAVQKKFRAAAGLVLTGIAGIVLNGPVSMAMSMGAMALMAGTEAATGLLIFFPALMIAAAANTAISIVLFKPLEGIWSKYK